ncbi:ATP-grasp domain-containing protein [Enterococcus timonensis]|uniref:ATP-grasp domain-containing protein n=1 Tax=Enterococcus timonensis TaxID=1852364 RepID=UPI0008DAF9F3|nr:ATP-grasp domain-containing protein [Enterococcus timonensis]
MKNYIIDVNTDVLIDALKKKGYVYKVKKGKNFSINEEDGYASVTFPSLDQKSLDEVITYFSDKKIDFVLSFNEDTRIFWYQYCEQTSTPTNIKKQYAEAKNKLNTRRLMNSVVTNKVKYFEIQDFLAGERVFPIILKPKMGKGSINVFKCNNNRELENILLQIEYANYFIEEFVEGNEFSVEALHLNGKHLIYGITTKLKYEGTVVEKGHISNITTFDDYQIKELYLIFDTLSYTDIFSHTEVILGKKGLIYVESHPRLGGDLIPTLTMPLFKSDFYDLFMDANLRNKRDGKIKLKEKTTTRFSYMPAPKAYPAKFMMNNEIEEELKEKFDCYIIISNATDGQLLTEKPKNSKERPLILAAEVGDEKSVFEVIKKIDHFCDENIFQN